MNSEETDGLIGAIKKRNYYLSRITSDFLVSHKYKFIYVACSKNACSSLKAFFGSHHNQSYSMLMNPHLKCNTHLSSLDELKADTLNQVIKSYFKFTFVRDPFKRVISCYRNRIASLGMESYDHEYIDNAILEYKTNKYNIMRHRKNFSSFIEFQDFIDYICDQDEYFMDRHWLSQFSSLSPDLINYDFIGDVDYLERDLAAISQMVGISPFHKDLNFSFNASGNYNIDEYFDDSLKKKFMKKFTKDFELYNSVKGNEPW